MILIGSRALEKLSIKLPRFRENADYDFIGTKEQWDRYKYTIVRNYEDVEVKKDNVEAIKDINGIHHEVNLVVEGSGTSDDLLMKRFDAYGTDVNIVPTVEYLFAMKYAHRFKKDTPFFLKTMYDILYLESLGYSIVEETEEFYKIRMKESLNYGHPKLNVKSGDFFNDSIYTYDHDTIHEAIAILDKPAYKNYMVDGQEVMTSKEKFMSLPEHIRLLGVYEETCVLALERSQIPNDFSIHPKHSFMMALEKVCTSITSGWFRQYAYDNYKKVIALYNHFGDNNYIELFRKNYHMVKPYKGKNDD